MHPKMAIKTTPASAVLLLMTNMKDKPSPPLSLLESYYSVSYQLNITWNHTMERNVGCSCCQAFLKVQKRRSNRELSTASLVKGIRIDQ